MRMKISTVACIGAGLIGQGWATVFALKCRHVILQDISPERLARSVEKIEQNLEFMEKNKLIDIGAAERAVATIHTTVDIAQAVQSADYVQESVPDDYALKTKVFGVMDAHAPKHVLLASSASGLKMTEIQRSVKNPGRCLLVHPCLPVHLIPCVEITGGQQTDPESVDTARTFMEFLGKSPLVLNYEVPGHIINRLQAALLREAMDLVERGVASAEDVDRAFRLGVGIRDPILGPLLRAHLAGDGIENFFQTYAQSYTYRFESMASWTSFPPSTAKAVAKSVHEMDIVRSQDLDEIKNWRDEMLVKIVGAMRENDKSNKV